MSLDTQPELENLPTEGFAKSAEYSTLHHLDIVSALRKLNRKQQQIVVLHIWYDRTMPEVAATMDIPLGTAKSSFWQALQKLRAILGDEYRLR